MRPSVPCFVAPQPAPESLAALREAAARKATPLLAGGTDWFVEATDSGFRYHDAHRQFALPRPSLPGVHQLTNAGLAIAALSVLPQPLDRRVMSSGLREAEWPARLQRLQTGRLMSGLPDGVELWLDGGHNDSAGEVLALQMESWRCQDGDQPLPLHIIMGMLSTKSPPEFFLPILPYVTRVTTLAIPGESLGLAASDLADDIRALGMMAVDEADDLMAALKKVSADSRVLICGSLYLAGHVLSCN